MTENGDVSYQLFQTYYTKAKSAENAGRINEAKKMYLLAGESLLKAARNVSGETKAAMIRRADKMQQLADMPEPEKSYGTEEEKNPGASNPSPREGESGNEGQKIWKSAEKPDVHFSDIAGLEEVKEAIRRRVILPYLYPEIYERFRRKADGGILLYGPPGTGKTMIAKAIAGEIDRVFFSVHCSDIVGKYFGESEKNIKSLFETARAAKSAVVFFDEFDALAAQRGDDSGVMNRLVSELLSQMDGFSSTNDSDILFLAATNRPWDLDSAFLRPPRLTNKIYVGLPDYEARLFLSRKRLEGVPCSDNVSVEYIAQSTEGFNCADVVLFCEMLKDGAIDRTIAEKTWKEITLEDVHRTKAFVHSSVRQEDIKMLEQWK